MGDVPESSPKNADPEHCLVPAAPAEKFIWSFASFEKIQLLYPPGLWQVQLAPTPLGYWSAQ